MGCFKQTEESMKQHDQMMAEEENRRAKGTPRFHEHLVNSLLPPKAEATKTMVCGFHSCIISYFFFPTFAWHCIEPAVSLPAPGEECFSEVWAIHVG